VCLYVCLSCYLSVFISISLEKYVLTLTLTFLLREVKTDVLFISAIEKVYSVLVIQLLVVVIFGILKQRKQ